jgi:AhpD family alkylhydroperoxidase
MEIRDHAPAAYRAMLRPDCEVAAGALERRIAELVRVRASQLNGCAYCVDMHTKDARAAGETEQRLYAVSAWREGPFFDERERAALALAEALTRPRDHEEVDRARAEAEATFEPDELAALILTIATINAWNAIAIGARMEAGTYEPEAAAA